MLLDEKVERLIHSAALLLEINLGATAIGTGLNTPPGYQEAAVRHLREVTGLTDIRGAADLLEATSDTGAYVSMHAAIKRLAVKLSKTCNDLRLLSSGPRAGLGPSTPASISSTAALTISSTRFKNPCVP